MQEAKHVINQMRFPQKLSYMLALGTDAILWGGTGRTILLNYKILQDYLQCDHSIFKTTNISSFIRQLNLYGFRKVTSHLQDPLCNSSNPYMHEFIHDNFQYGRPELLNKITRKALTVKKSFKPKSSIDQLVCISPLQKARRALRIALRKATQDLLLLNSAKSKSRYDDIYEDYNEDEEKEEVGCVEITENTVIDTSNELTQPDPIHKVMPESCSDDKCGKKDIPQESLMDFSVDACQQNNFPATEQFLSMPDLDGHEDTTGVELLAEFYIDSETEHSIAIKSNESQPECNSLNCVLPSVSNEHNDDVLMLEKNNEDINHSNSEWEQILNDMMSNRNSNQEGVSNFRELYSQIYQTMNLLNS
ncbi:heat stress transcription factor A-6b-like [Maniola jurtina]|uniref:heat stress transcription factor A-6b-like n=1 Tax=Maniola jurtina TaxID=191418 RepID=UPI001E68945A|nr:heat stress transcription factor A-6b-like [Maniola jurtina]